MNDEKVSETLRAMAEQIGFLNGLTEQLSLQVTGLRRTLDDLLLRLPPQPSQRSPDELPKERQPGPPPPPLHADRSEPARESR
jgi:hypothetical protein